MIRSLGPREHLRSETGKMPGLEQGVGTHRPCNCAGGCHWARRSSGMCPPDCAAPAVLPVLPSCPGLLARLAGALGSVGLYPQVEALALIGTHMPMCLMPGDGPRQASFSHGNLTDEADGTGAVGGNSDGAREPSFRGSKEEASVSRAPQLAVGEELSPAGLGGVSGGAAVS